MAAIPTSVLAVVAQAVLALQVTQADLYNHLTSSDGTLLAASLWVNIALAGLSILVFVFMAKDVEDPRAQLIVIATILVPVVSISSYTGLVSGLTMGVLDPTAAGVMADGETINLADGSTTEGVVIPWGRYLTWALSTPMILLAIGLLAGSNITKIFTAITFDIAMCVTGLAAALTTSNLALRWFWYALSCTFFLVVLYILLVEWPKDAEATGTADIFNTLKLLTVAMWLGYPIVWAVGAEGVGLLDSAITSWAYSILDIVAKYIFAFLLINYVVDEPAGVTSSSDYGSTSPGVTPTDD